MRGASDIRGFLGSFFCRANATRSCYDGGSFQKGVIGVISMCSGGSRSNPCLRMETKHMSYETQEDDCRMRLSCLCISVLIEYATVACVTYTMDLYKNGGVVKQILHVL